MEWFRCVKITTVRVTARHGEHWIPHVMLVSDFHYFRRKKEEERKKTEGNDL